MKNRERKTQNGWRKLFLATAGIAAMVLPVVAGVLTPPRLPPQAPASTADMPKFEAASIKPNRSGDRSSGGNAQQPGRYTGTNITLRNLIANAYYLTPGQSVTRIFGSPNWIDSAHFDIEAEAEGNPAADQKRLMLQSLLADRFQMVLHHEMRQLPVYALVVAKPGKTGPQLKPHSDEAKCIDFDPSAPPPPPKPGEALTAFCGGFNMFGRLPTVREVGNKITIDMLVAMLSNFVDRPVVDRTRLSGVFDATLEFAFAFQQGGGSVGTAMIPSDPSGPPSLFTALQEQLGLKLESTKGPVDVLVIDHVEQPSEN